MHNLQPSDKPAQHKVVILGDSQVGKTSIITRELRGCRPDTQNPTIGCHCSEINLTVDGEEMKLSIWDTAGQEMYRSLVPVYLRGAEAALLVYDVTDRESFRSLGHWKDLLLDNVPETTLMFVVGNKIDLDENVVVEDVQAQQFAQQQNSKLYKVSAMTGQGIGLLFEDVARAILEVRVSQERQHSELQPNTRNGSGCC